uniref:Uncharacterized protein n=1 Tax=Rhizochromulina marina TaxID=1034831 RepID=A0A7S2SG84_9STRA|mmetsp:Transcript_29411/g.85735  ORF Transcript_29411/g.85735 Transcript_29411/m.85735 type:complete len:165 (+) Transcript_29411:169-663(+)|eukprot:CAMPEP_0118961610 /NCGR_PEP_ID=MMETSP1173-20130426/238_1 /TAXON_ID=1034831 /ORGANISM="Rhizochromulina marina cf, Strain CCMP1243" /LENGTH=164 /DNA_ID=CAMNT_0006909791 /DNA_START=111 /DNA_END=605 /DNA_ORIENTATION=-
MASPEQKPRVQSCRAPGGDMSAVLSLIGDFVKPLAPAHPADPAPCSPAMPSAAPVVAAPIDPSTPVSPILPSTPPCSPLAEGAGASPQRARRIIDQEQLEGSAQLVPLMQILRRNAERNELDAVSSRLARLGQPGREDSSRMVRSNKGKAMDGRSERRKVNAPY